MKPPKFLREIAKVAHEQGWTCAKTRNNHIKFRAPSGETVFTSSTPGDVRAVHNLTAMLRRKGLNI